MLRGRLCLAVILVLTVLAAGSPALAQLCLTNPISPLCCPSPCPIFDVTRVPKLVAQLAVIRQAVGADSQLVQAWSQLDQSIGAVNASAEAVKRQAESLFSNPAVAAPSRADLPATPAATLNMLKATLFEEGGGQPESATRRSAGVASRLDAVRAEEVNALATSLASTGQLSAVAARQAPLAALAAGATRLREDFATNSAVRIALFEDVEEMHQLASAWVAQRSTRSGLLHPDAAGGTTVQPPGGGGDGSSGSQLAEDGQAAAQALDRLVAIHDGRLAAQALLSAYPALQQTIAGAAMARQFAASAEAAMKDGLSGLGLGAAPDLTAVERTLRALDGSGWLDAGKAAQAGQAASTALEALSRGAPAPVDDGAAGRAASAMAAWLEADKQSRYWAGLSASAQSDVAALDARLGALSDRAGVDVTSASARAREASVLGELGQNPSALPWQATLAAAAQDTAAHSALRLSREP